MFQQRAGYVFISRPPGVFIGGHDDIKARKIVLILTEALPYKSLDPVALCRIFYPFPGNCEPEPGASQVIPAGNDQ